MAQRDDSKTKLIHVESDYFSAGVVLNQQGLVVHTAPILKYMFGWTEKRVIEYIQQKGWWFSE